MRTGNSRCARRFLIFRAPLLLLPSLPLFASQADSTSAAGGHRRMKVIATNASGEPLFVRTLAGYFATGTRP